MSDQSVHLAKWMAALEQVWQISIFSERHLSKWHMPAPSQVIPQTGARWFFLHSDKGRVLLRCGKGMTNKQWSIVGVVNDFLDLQRVQYSLLPQGGLVSREMNTLTAPHKQQSSH